MERESLYILEFYILSNAYGYTASKQQYHTSLVIEYPTVYFLIKTSITNMIA